MVDLIVHPAAQLEFENGAQWYADRSESVAERFISEVEAAIQEVCKRPDRYALIDDRHRLFRIQTFPYYLAYRLRPGLVEIVAIRHASRDQEAWKGR